MDTTAAQFEALITTARQSANPNDFRRINWERLIGSVPKLPPHDAAGRERVDQSDTRVLLKTITSPLAAPTAGLRRSRSDQRLHHPPVHRAAVLAAVNYGRDADSIATMVGSLCGALLHGIAAIPEDWRDTVSRSSRLDLTANGRTMAAVARDIYAKDRKRVAAWAAAFDALVA